MEFNVGDHIRYKLHPEQMGTITRLKPLGVSKAVVVEMENGPMYGNLRMRAYFSASVDELEKCPC